MKSLTWQAVWRWRVARHYLDEAAPMAQLVDMVGALCGVHAQVLASAELAIGLRVHGATANHVQEELWAHRRLVKTYGMRGTVHLFPANELPLWLAALRAGSAPREQAWLARVGMDQARVGAVVEAIRDALDGRRLTLEELGEEVAHRVGGWAMEQTLPAFGGTQARWTAAIGAAATAGALCFGPNLGARVTFVRPDQWLGREWAEPDPQQALAEVLRRYLAAYGPATHRQFAQWFYMRPGLARDLVRSLAEELEEVDVEGERCWLLASQAQAPPPPAHETVRLLPYFDPYVVGCHPRDRLAPPAYNHRVFPGGGAGRVPVVLTNGVVAGVWERRRTGTQLEVLVEPFGALGSAQRRRLEAEATRIGQIVGAEARLTVGAVDARPHL